MLNATEKKSDMQLQWLQCILAIQYSSQWWNFMSCGLLRIYAWLSTCCLFFQHKFNNRTNWFKCGVFLLQLLQIEMLLVCAVRCNKKGIHVNINKRTNHTSCGIIIAKTRFFAAEHTEKLNKMNAARDTAFDWLYSNDGLCWYEYVSVCVWCAFYWWHTLTATTKKRSPHR